MAFLTPSDINDFLQDCFGNAAKTTTKFLRSTERAVSLREQVGMFCTNLRRELRRVDPSWRQDFLFLTDTSIWRGICVLDENVFLQRGLVACGDGKNWNTVDQIHELFHCINMGRLLMENSTAADSLTEQCEVGLNFCNLLLTEMKSIVAKQELLNSEGDRVLEQLADVAL